VRWFSVLFLVMELEGLFEDLHTRLSTVKVYLPGARRPTPRAASSLQRPQVQQNSKASQDANKQQQEGAAGLEVRVEEPRGARACLRTPESPSRLEA
jgi:hypothetical protein